MGAALAAGVVSGCLTESERADDGPRPDVERTTQALTASNGLTFNGLGGNGLAVNGLAVNGIGANGLAVNGLAVNGRALNGLAVNGIGVNGIGVNGIGVNGLAVNGFAVNGIGVNGLYVNGIGVNGLYVNGLAVNGIAANGIGVNGLAVNGLYVDGMAASGGAMNGLYVNGVSLAKVKLNGLVINGSTASTGIKVGLANGTIGALTTAQATELRDRVMPYLAYCALPASSTGRNPSSCSTDAGCVSITDHAGAVRYYWGSAGYAPGWKTAGLTTTASDLVEGCLKQACVAAGGNCQKNVALNSQQEAQLDQLLKYLVSCALPPPADPAPTTVAACDADAGCATVYNSSNVAKFYYGAMDLARTWKTAALTTTGQQRISACLGARTNANAETVHISMRGMGLAADAIEKARFGRHEGGFYGDLFTATPELHTCEVDGGGMAGRVCANGQCGFINDGRCPDACSTLNADGTYSNCDGFADVLNTFLPFQKTDTAGEMHACAIRDSGEVWCWGKNAAGQLGDNTTTDRYTSATKSLLPSSSFGVDQVLIGPSNTCARRRDGTVWCWGDNSKGQLGNGTTTSSRVPVQVKTSTGPMLTSIVDLDMKREMGCGLAANGSVWCWGRNYWGGLGDGTRTNRPTAAEVVSAGRDNVGLAVGSYHACVLKAAGTVYCWGDNRSGRVGEGIVGTVCQQIDNCPTSMIRYSAVQVKHVGGTPLTDVVQIDAGHYGTIALKSDGTVWGWGETAPQNGTLGIVIPVGDLDIVKWGPVRIMKGAGVPLDADVKHIALGEYNVCALRANGEMWCGGENDRGQLLDGTTTASKFAKKIAAVGTDNRAVRGGHDILCVEKKDRSQYCWGNNTVGNIGDKTTVHPRTSPTRTSMFVLKGDSRCDFAESPVSAKEGAECVRVEVCNDNLDNDGDGATDCADAECVGEAICP